MVADDLTFFTQDSDKFGDTIARTKRVISKLLLDWASGDNGIDGAGRAKRRSTYLTPIYFDKLAEFYCRVWDELNLIGKVRYPSGLQRQRGFHGPGRAIRINRTEDEKISLGTDPADFRRHQWAFTTEIVEKLKPSIGNARLLFRLSRNAWDLDCGISSEIDASQWEAWLKDSENVNPNVPFLTAIEREYVLEISRIISSLDQGELRALGTHSSADETYKDLKFNLYSWNSRFGEIARYPYHQKPIELCTYQLVTTTREIKKKSADNAKVYNRAHKKALASCRSEEILTIIRNVQRPVEEIWGDERIKRFAATADHLLNLSLYIRRGFSQIGEPSRLEKKEVLEADRAYVALLVPHPNVTLSLRPFADITRDDATTWIEELEEAQNRLFGFLPALRNTDQLGIP